MFKLTAKALSVVIISTFVTSNPALAQNAGTVDAIQLSDQVANLQSAINSNPADLAAVSQLTNSIVTSDPNQAANIIALATPETESSIAQGLSQASANLISENPQGYQIVQNAILSSSPSFQSAYLTFVDEGATGAIGATVNAAPGAALTGAAGAGGAADDDASDS